ncbi:hypothetical protein V9T40_007862 [Parthenolecanium corni]|uniref:Lysosomal dipeptide transporter MFSD1 n=1 Tax=Parthenolecanium corni TaxID=536013 RepID=A0AAN9Y5D4_9HEMI
MEDAGLLITNQPVILITHEPAIPSTSSRIPDSGANSQRVTLSHPNHWLQKIVALSLMCVLGFGSYFCYDNPGALQDFFESDLHLKTSEFMLLYSWYSWPNIIMCSVGGLLIDGVFGIRLGTCIYALLVVIGQLLVAGGAFYNCFTLLIFGRFIFGIGGESLAVAQNSYAVLWFKGDLLNMVFGFQLSIARAGSAVNFLLMNSLYKYVNNYFSGYQCLGITLLIAGSSCLLSFFSGILLGLQDKNAERKLNRNQNQTGERIKLSDVKHFGKSFWIITFAITFYYSAIFAFVALGKVFFEKRFNLPANRANFVNSLLYFIAAFLAPALGIVIDKFGKNVTFVFLSLLITILGHILLTLPNIDPIISMCFIGVAYSMIACALWPLIALVTPGHLLGTAYGIAQSLQNLGTGVIQYIAGEIVDVYSYSVLEAYFIGCFILALFLILLLWIQDWSTNGYLNMSTRQRKAFDKNNATPEDVDSVERERLLDSDYGSVSEEDQTHSEKK